MVKGARKKKPDPFSEHTWHYLAIRRWHASFDGPRWQRKEVSHADWRGGPDWIEHQYELENAESLSLKLVVEPYRQALKVGKRDIASFEFEITSSTDPIGGLFQICPDGELRGWISLPVSGVQGLLTLLASGHSVVLEVHGSGFKRGTALVHTTSGWSTEGHPRVEDEFA